MEQNISQPSQNPQNQEIQSKDQEKIEEKKQQSQVNEELMKIARSQQWNFLIADEELKSWYKSNLQKDIDNAKQKGANPLELIVKNTMVIRNEKGIFNRVEFDTKFDFNNISQILISPEVQNEKDKAFYYVTVVLIVANNTTPLVFPYCYKKQNVEDKLESIKEEGLTKKEKKKLKKKINKRLSKISKNELNYWIFVNSDNVEVIHNVAQYNEI